MKIRPYIFVLIAALLVSLSNQAVSQFINPTFSRSIPVPRVVEDYSAAVVTFAGNLWTRDNVSQQYIQLDRTTGEVLGSMSAPDGSGERSYTDIVSRSWVVASPPFIWDTLFANGDGEIIRHNYLGEITTDESPVTEGALGIATVGNMTYVAGTSTQGTGIFSFGGGFITNPAVASSSSMASIGPHLLLLYPDSNGEDYMLGVIDTETGAIIEDHLIFSSTASVSFGMCSFGNELYVARNDLQEIHVYDISPVLPAGIFRPDSVVTHRGVRRGTSAAAAVSDDVKLVHQPGFTLNTEEVSITVDFRGTSPILAPSTVSITVESAASTPGLGIYFSFYNFNTNSFDRVGAVNSHSFNTDVARTYNGDPANHIDPITGQVWVRYEVPLLGILINYPYSDRIDYVEFQVEP